MEMHKMKGEYSNRNNVKENGFGTLTPPPHTHTNTHFAIVGTSTLYYIHMGHYIIIHIKFTVKARYLRLQKTNARFNKSQLWKVLN